MNNRFIFFMTFAVIIGIVVILAMNIASAFGIHQFKYLSPNDVRGMAIEHNGLLYTLNFDQQNSLLDLLNQATPINSKGAQLETSSTKPNFEKIVIYRFNAPDIEIRPITYSATQSHPSKEEALVFSAPAITPHGLMQEAVPNGFKQLISQTFDHK